MHGEERGQSEESKRKRAEEQERAGPWTERSGPWATGGNDLGARRNGRGIGDSETKYGRQQSEAQEGNARVQGGAGEA